MKTWEKTQDEYYLANGSNKLGRTWVAGLVNQSYSLLHNQWTYRIGILHERDAQGLRIKEGEELEKSIDAQFELGKDGLITHPIGTLSKEAEKRYGTSTQATRKLGLAASLLLGMTRLRRRQKQQLE